MGRLKVAQDEIRIVKESLAAKATPEPVIPWEPNAKGCFLRGDAKEKKVAKASKFFTFYQRLYQLAMECNAKHTAKHTKYGYFRVFYSYVGFKWCVRGTNKPKQEPTDLFTSQSSAQEACDIMNRDGWRLPNP